MMQRSCMKYLIPTSFVPFSDLNVLICFHAFMTARTRNVNTHYLLRFEISYSFADTRATKQSGKLCLYAK